MKIINKNIRDCEMEDGTKNKVLELTYTHRGEEGRIFVKDYNDSFYTYILKQLRKQVRDSYNQRKAIGV